MSGSNQEQGTLDAIASWYRDDVTCTKAGTWGGTEWVSTPCKNTLTPPLEEDTMPISDFQREARQMSSSVGECLRKILEVNHEESCQWEKSDESFLWCIEYLGISAHVDYADRMVNALEARMEEVIAEQIPGMVRGPVERLEKTFDECGMPRKVSVRRGSDRGFIIKITVTGHISREYLFEDMATVIGWIQGNVYALTGGDPVHLI